MTRYDELRKIAIEESVKAHAGQSPGDGSAIVKCAKAFYEFLSGKDSQS
jgi:hypothetical protein